MIELSDVYKINASDKVFIDTNILIFLFSPSFVSSKRFQVDKYSSIVEKLVEKQCTLYINSLVIAEFINRCLRLDFEKNFNKDGDKNYKKDYRPSPEYQETLKLVLKELKKFLKISTQINDYFESFDVLDTCNRYLESDFNDLIIADTVKKNDLKLLSDDGDFKNTLGIDTEWYLK